MQILVLRFSKLRLEFLKVLFETLSMQQLFTQTLFKGFCAFLVGKKLVLLAANFDFCLLQLATELSVFFCKSFDVGVEVYKKPVEII